MIPAPKLAVIGKPVTAKQALPVVTGNYEACKVIADRLTDLQEWARGQGAP